MAQIGAAHGIRGEVRIKPFIAEPGKLAAYGSLQSEDGARTFEIESLQPSKDMLIARLKGIADRVAAEELCNVRLYVPRERLPAADENEFYHADLIGLAVVDAHGQPLGTVAALPNFGAGDLLEIAPADGRPSVLLPFTKAVVPTVDIRGGRVVIEPPDGAFEPPPTRVGLPPARAQALVGEGGEDRRSEPREGSVSSHALRKRIGRPLARSRASRGPTLPHKGGG